MGEREGERRADGRLTGEVRSQEGNRGSSSPLAAESIATDRREAYFARRRNERNEGIERLIAEARSRGQSADRAFWSMVYDFELAPLTTNAKQLAELGVEVPPEADLSDDALPDKLWAILRGLAELNIYLVHTDHLSDRELYRRLVSEILAEEIRDVVGADNVVEWVDLCNPETDGEWAQFEELYGEGKDVDPARSPRDPKLPRPPGWPTE